MTTRTLTHTLERPSHLEDFNSIVPILVRIREGTIEISSIGYNTLYIEALLTGFIIPPDVITAGFQHYELQPINLGRQLELYFVDDTADRDTLVNGQPREHADEVGEVVYLDEKTDRFRLDFMHKYINLAWFQNLPAGKYGREVYFRVASTVFTAACDMYFGVRRMRHSDKGHFITVVDIKHDTSPNAGFATARNLMHMALSNPDRDPWLGQGVPVLTNDFERVVDEDTYLQGMYDAMIALVETADTSRGVWAPAVVTFADLAVDAQSIAVDEKVSLVLPPARGRGQLTYTISTLPEGLTFDDQTRLILGTPTEASTGNITLTATDADSNVATLDFALQVA